MERKEEKMLPVNEIITDEQAPPNTGPTGLPQIFINFSYKSNRLG